MTKLPEIYPQGIAFSNESATVFEISKSQIPSFIFISAFLIVFVAVS